jgi:hypothetical protein
MMRDHRILSGRVSGLGLVLAMSASVSAGPDLICSEITSAASFGFADGRVAYSFGTTLCNIGDAELPWDANTNEHPLISQTLYKLKDHQLTQIGIGFVRHTTIPLAGNACGLDCTPAGFDALGVGCSDTSSSAINGAQGLMGPRSEVNAFTGDFPYPFTAINQTGDAIYKRLQVDLGDMSDPDALYFVETQVITSAETDAAIRNNNVSYRQVLFSPGSANASLTGPTYTQQPAIFAWRDHGNGIGIPDPDVLITQATIPNDGIIHAGSRATDLDDGTWRYDYAIHNQNSSQGIGWIEHSLGVFGDAHALAFESVAYHDDLDELIDDSDWLTEFFDCDTYNLWFADGFVTNPLANEIRWGTTSSFSFITSTEPRKEVAYGLTIGYNIASAADGEPYFLNDIDAVGPPSGEFCVCPADLNGDGTLNFFDVSAFIQLMASGGDYNGDGMSNFFDVSDYIQDFSAGCP